MNTNNGQKAVRYPRASVSQLTVNFLHMRSPIVAAFFSLAYPGFGQMLQQRLLKAFILISWELFINQKAHVNLGILYTMLGQFDKAKQVLDERWLPLYIGIYTFAIWNGYRTTVDMNKLARLAQREKVPVPRLAVGTWNINYLGKSSPASALFWSAVVPGLGHLYVHKMVTGLFLFFYTVTVFYYSNSPLAILYTLTGQFDAARMVIDMQWFMYIPSIYCFVLYDAYVSAVELNFLFEQEQSEYLQASHQPSDFPMPVQ
jgi:hypothetical protein